MNGNELYVVNGFEGTSKKTGNVFYALNVVVKEGKNALSTRMLFVDEDIVKYVNEKGAGYYKYECGFGNRLISLEQIKPFTL